MQFESHVMLESDSIPLGKNFKLARMRFRGDDAPECSLAVLYPTKTQLADLR
jgi:hypothetical protein